MGIVTSDWKIDVLLALSTVCFLIYYKIRNTYLYFEKKNIKYVKPTFLLGSDPSGLLFKTHCTEGWDRVYKELQNEKYGGFYQAVLPTLMVRDPEYINDFLKTSFEHFHDRNFLVDEKTNPLDENLFFIRGNKWKYMRSQMAPLFSNVKLKWMYEEIERCVNVFDECISQLLEKDVNMKDLLGRFAGDVTASCGFGVEPQALKNPDWEFLQIGREFFDPNKLNMFIFLLRFSIPHVFQWLKIKTVTTKIRNFFLSTTESILHQRKSTGMVRKDFVQLLIDLKAKGKVKVDSKEIEKNSLNKDSSYEKIELSDNFLAAQSFIFFMAGFETTSTTLYFTFYFLAKHPEIQERARKEVLEVKAKYGDFPFDSLKELKFLDKCILESMRLYPAAPVIFRECTKDYTLPNGTIIDKGVGVIVPIMSVHRDPKYYPEPLEYKPDRFDNPPASGTYLPFGDGPRMCIGKRFAETVMHCILARILEKYRFELSPMNKNEEEIKLNPKVFSCNPLHGLLIRIHKLSDSS